MKTITKGFSLLAALLLVLTSNTSKAQCGASINATAGSGGTYNFASAPLTPNPATATYTWSFGNSTYSAGVGITNATANYANVGTYTVYLSVNDGSCYTFTQTVINVTNAPGCAINPSFNYSESANGVINFTNTTTGVIPSATYTVDYGDGSPTSSTFASHTYSANGTYIVWVTADNNITPTCASTQSFAVNVTSYCNIVAGYNTTQLGSGSVGFTSTSTGTTTSTLYNWNFGDGTSNSVVNGPTVNHTYINGSYIATLTILSNSATAFPCSSTYTMSVTVSSNTCNVVSSYNYVTGSSGSVSFNNTTTGTVPGTTYFWNFGDGNSSTATSPTHSYANPGFYLISLTAINGTSLCSSYSSQTLNISTGSCVANAQFSVSPTATAQIWNVIPSAPANVIAAQWQWGDGSTSNTLYTSHSYATAGTYTLCLTVTVSCGSTATWCGSYYINKSAQDMSMIQVNVVAPSPTGIKANSIDADKLQLYPNPNAGDFNINLGEAVANDVTISVYNSIGQLVQETQVNKGETIKNIKLENVTNGAYFIKVNSGNMIHTKMLMINK